METIIWKIRYAIAIHKLVGVSFRDGYEMAVSTLEMLCGDISECSPQEAAEEERDEWIRCS